MFYKWKVVCVENNKEIRNVSRHTFKYAANDICGELNFKCTVPTWTYKVVPYTSSADGEIPCN